jgi:uncharacterized protein (DUF433 family)
LARTGIRSEVIARSAKAEGSLSAVALAFGITEAEVKQALLFEERLAA